MSKTIRSFDRRACLAAITLLLFLLAGFSPAEAAKRPLDPPRAQGIVGERFDGFAVLRKKATSAVKKLVDQTNKQRRSVYQKRAKATKTTIQAVGRIYAKEIMKNAPRGTWFQHESGKWSKKK
jgi:uncharacterized protein YdbL (DUF1318 family)